MPLELRLSFPAPDRAAVQLLDDSLEESSVFHFANPLTDKDLEEIRWYLEDYGSRYAAKPDDERADTVRQQLRAWGAALFNAVFKADDTAMELYRRFRDQEQIGRLLTIAASHPAVLSLPWELLRPADGVFLFAENPRIAIRRGLPAAGQGRKPHKRDPKAVLRLLFIVSRPEGASFINPRTDPQAVLNALDLQEQQRAEVEFLRPATLAALENRLRSEPAIDIIHFDGHGMFDRNNSLRDKAASLPSYMQGLLREAEERGGDAPAGGQGYLLFEDEAGGQAFADARSLGELLFRQKVGLVVLSACQSAAMGKDDAMSGVAARLVHAGIPAVLAMTHSVLVKTTETLFAEFYRSLFKGGATGTALDDARAALRRNPNRGIRLRGEDNTQEVILELEDWFLPALYQNGADKPLLSTEGANSLPAKSEPPHNLPKPQESGFFGRSEELWQIERAFAVKGCRRFSITGFGGQGKTALAVEAGRWLLRTQLFKRACFVSFSSYQGNDPVSWTVSVMSDKLHESLLDAAAAEKSLKKTSTLLILDNLESLADRGNLAELLDAAVLWSEAGASRVLLTSRQPDFNHHPAYPLAGSYAHQTLALQGLCEDDAVAWFDSLRSLRPASTLKRPRRDALLRLFKLVDFHPLSISLLAQQLKERGPADVGERLEALLALQPLNREDRSLLASLELSLERLPERCRTWLPRLGVFQGGGLEKIVASVTELEEYPKEWSQLQYHLSLSGLMQEERVAGNTFLRFHPTLAPALWKKLDEAERFQLMERHSQAYCQLADEMYDSDKKNADITRPVAIEEMSNLLRSAYWYIKHKKERSAAFAAKVCAFLNSFSMRREAQALSELSASQNQTDFQSWVMAQRALGEQLYADGKYREAGAVFDEILAKMPVS